MHKFFTENGATYGLCRFFSNTPNSVENAIDVYKVSASLQNAHAKKLKGIFIGVVDADKREQPFFKTFTEIFNNEGVIVKQSGNLFLISLSPQVDGFIYANAADVSIDLSKYKFSTERKKFMKGLKTYGIDTKPEFKNLLNDLKQKRCSCFVALQNAFDYIYKQR